MHSSRLPLFGLRMRSELGVNVWRWIMSRLMQMRNGWNQMVNSSAATLGCSAWGTVTIHFRGNCFLILQVSQNS